MRAQARARACVRATHVSEVCMVREKERKKEMCVYVPVRMCVYVRACKEDVYVCGSNICVSTYLSIQGVAVRCRVFKF